NNRRSGQRTADQQQGEDQRGRGRPLYLKHARDLIQRPHRRRQPGRQNKHGQKASKTRVKRRNRALKGKVGVKPCPVGVPVAHSAERSFRDTDRGGAVIVGDQAAKGAVVSVRQKRQQQ